MSIKQNFSQAMKELFKPDADDNIKAKDEAQVSSEINTAVTNNNADYSKEDINSSDTTENQNNTYKEEKTMYDSENLLNQENGNDGNDNKDNQYESTQSAAAAVINRLRQAQNETRNKSDFGEAARTYENGNVSFNDNQPQSSEVTVISKSTQIIGDIRSFSQISIDGEVSGDIQSAKSITVRGRVVGNITGEDVVMNGSSTQGNIESKGTLTITSDAVLLGDVKAQNINVDGKVKGNMETGYRVSFGNNAIILGNVTATLVAIEEGAKIQGYINTASTLQENNDDIFPTAITINEGTANA